MKNIEALGDLEIKCSKKVNKIIHFCINFQSYLYIDKVLKQSSRKQKNYMYKNSFQAEKVTLVQQIRNLIEKGQGAYQIKCLVRSIEEMFDYSYIYRHLAFQNAVNSNPKGYVPFSIIFQQQSFTNTLNQRGFSHITPSEYEIIGLFLHYQIKKGSKILWSNPGNVRRMNLCPIEINAVFVQNFPYEQKCSDFQDLIGSQCNIIKIDYDEYFTWAIVYTDDPSALAKLNGYQWPDTDGKNDKEVYEEPLRLKVYTREEFERVEASIRRSRTESKLQKLYRSKCINEYPCIIRLERESKESKDKSIQKGYEADEQLYQQAEKMEDREYL